jgi:hypothetical protein
MHRGLYVYTLCSHSIGRWLCCVTSWTGRSYFPFMFPPSLSGLYCRLPKCKPGQGLSWLGPPPRYVCPWTGSREFWIWAIPRISVWNMYMSLFYMKKLCITYTCGKGLCSHHCLCETNYRVVEGPISRACIHKACSRKKTDLKTDSFQTLFINAFLAVYPTFYRTELSTIATKPSWWTLSRGSDNKNVNNCIFHCKDIKLKRGKYSHSTWTSLI